ncbi:MAG: Allene oxide cyclase [Rhizobiales bacterium]|nr:Allene oxide cyclase [Hyphomicrobiales bacterium]MBI3673781.1 Allene oxide cyclase [Hyphomicrobiales bacterium]
MKTIAGRTGIALAAVTGVTLLGSAPATAASTMALVERATTDAVTDTGAKGDSVGDLLTFANDIYDEANKTKLGSDNGFCIRTAVGKAWECYFTTSLDGGQLTAEGPFYDGQDSMLAITGGTGKYTKARGEMLLHARNAEGSEYDFKFNLAD